MAQEAVPHGSMSELRARGRAARKTLPRHRHGELRIDDRDPVALLDAQNRTRIRELVPVRWGRMLQSVFAFYRGSAALMAHDLAEQAVTGVQVVCCGDAHLGNFGFYRSPERRLVFDLNDFDEASNAPRGSGTSSGSRSAWSSPRGRTGSTPPLPQP